MIRKCRLWLIFCAFLLSTSIAYAGVNEWICKGLHEECIEDLAIDPFTPATIYAGTWEGVFKSSDGGENWTSANEGLSGLIISTLAIDPLTPTTIYASTPGRGIFKSSDGGENWVEMNEG